MKKRVYEEQGESRGHDFCIECVEKEMLDFKKRMWQHKDHSRRN